LCRLLYFCHGCGVGVVVRDDVATDLSTCDRTLAQLTIAHVTGLSHPSTSR
jgi:hypothetical protein